MAPGSDVRKATSAAVRGTGRAYRWIGRNVGNARRISGANNTGMMRLLDLHAVSCAGDTLVTIGLAGTIFFSMPAGEARGRVALYLFVTMVPFALLAPVVGPLLDRFRHGRRIALAVTMLGRAALAWIMADHLFGFGLYPAAFGVLALSRAYGVARSAAVPRLLPRGMGLSQAGARASVYGTVAGAVVAPIGALAFSFGPQWPLRVASLIFMAGAVVSLALPPKADSDAPEMPPRLFWAPWRRDAENGLPPGELASREALRSLSGPLLVPALIGSACLRALYGFMLLFMAFAIRENSAPTRMIGIEFGDAAALGVIGGGLALGTFLATTIGTGLTIKRPLRLQAFGLVLVALTGAWAALAWSLSSIALFGLAIAIASGLAKLSVDATIQERVPERVRASAFAHSETLLMLAWVAGGALGLVPVPGRVGIIIAALAVVAAAVRAFRIWWARRDEVLKGRAAPPVPASAPLAHTKVDLGTVDA